MIYLQTASHVQRHFLYVGGGESFQAVLPPFLYEVVEGLLAAVFHGQTLGAVFGCGKRSETLTLTQRHGINPPENASETKSRHLKSAVIITRLSTTWLCFVGNKKKTRTYN